MLLWQNTLTKATKRSAGLSFLITQGYIMWWQKVKVTAAWCHWSHCIRGGAQITSFFLYSQSSQSKNPCHLLSTFFLNQHSFLPSFLKNRSTVPECCPPNSKLNHIQPKNSWSGLLPQWSKIYVLKFVLVTFLDAMIKSCKINLREERILLTHLFFLSMV